MSTAEPSGSLPNLALLTPAADAPIVASRPAAIKAAISAGNFIPRLSCLGWMIPARSRRFAHTDTARPRRTPADAGIHDQASERPFHVRHGGASTSGATARAGTYSNQLPHEPQRFRPRIPARSRSG